MPWSGIPWAKYCGQSAGGAWRVGSRDRHNGPGVERRWVSRVREDNIRASQGGQVQSLEKTPQGVQPITAAGTCVESTAQDAIAQIT